MASKARIKSRRVAGGGEMKRRPARRVSGSVQPAPAAEGSERRREDPTFLLIQNVRDLDPDPQLLARMAQLEERHRDAQAAAGY